VTLEAQPQEFEAGETRLWIEGVVSGWAAKDQYLELAPPEGGNWVVLGLDGQRLPLLAAPLAPTGFGPDRCHAGFYARHLAGDRLLVAVEGTGNPWVLGGRQPRIAAIDDAGFDVVLGATKVGVLTSGKTKDPAASHGIVADGPNAGISGDKLSVLHPTLEVTQAEVEVTGDVKVHGSFDATRR
jgi:hypothetical protein